MDEYVRSVLRDGPGGISLESYGVKIVNDGRSGNRKPSPKPKTAAKRRTSPARKPVARRTATKGARR